MSMKKFAIGAEAVMWLLAVGVVGAVGLPVGVLLALAGMLLSWMHIDVISGVVDCFLLGLLKSSRFIMHRVKALIRRSEELKAQ